MKIEKRVPSTTPVAQTAVRKQRWSSKYFEEYRHKLSTNIISKPLTIENYREKFHHLLCWEEKEHCDILTKRYRFI